MKCKLCEKFYKEHPLKKGEGPLKDGQHIIHKEGNFTHSMGKVECAFESGTFGDNWNCQTMGTLREIAETQEPCYQLRSDDCGSIGVIPVFEEIGADQQGYLIMFWYKDRGRTDKAYIMDEDNQEPLDLQTAEKIIDYYDSKRTTK